MDISIFEGDFVKILWYILLDGHFWHPKCGNSDFSQNYDSNDVKFKKKFKKSLKILKNL